jgi:hypothetical protein
MAVELSQVSYLLQAWGRIAKCLGQDFIPYLAVVMPPLLKSAEVKPDITITDADDYDEDEDEEGTETVTLNNKRISIQTSVLEEKATACNMICCYITELKDGFLPYIDPVAKIMIPLVKFVYHDEVRSAAVTCMPELVKCAVIATKKGQCDGEPSPTRCSLRVWKAGPAPRAATDCGQGEPPCLCRRLRSAARPRSHCRALRCRKERG